MESRNSCEEAILYVKKEKTKTKPKPKLLYNATHDKYNTFIIGIIIIIEKCGFPYYYICNPIICPTKQKPN